MKNAIKSFFFYAMLTFTALGLSIAAESATGIQKTINLTAGKADTIDLGKEVADVLVANPAIADVGTLRANRLYIVGKTIGDTNVLAFDEAGNQLADISVHVRVDDEIIGSTIREFFPDEKVEVATVNSNIILKGHVSTPAVANQVRDIASRFITQTGQTVVDLMSVRGEQQVMLKVKIIEAKRGALREYGIETDYKPSSIGTPHGLLNSIAGTGLQSLAPFASGQIFFDDNGKFGPLKIGLQALEKDGLINTLAEPNITAISGETAGFLAGGEFPVPTGRDQDGNVTLEFKQFGVALNFTPTVLSEDRISLQMSTEVSDKSADDGIVLVNTIIPGLVVRKAETTVQIGSGGTLMIAGLIKSDTINAMNGLPGVSDLPILGNLFKSKSFKRDESELIILVTPYIVEPYARPEAEVVQNDPAPVRQVLPLTNVPADTRKVAKMTALAPQGGDKGESATSRAFMNNLKKSFGSKAPVGLSAGPSYGYMVD